MSGHDSGRVYRVQRALVVSIHDVAPATREPVEEIVRQIAALGVSACSLLVVPDYHRRGRSMADENFCAWLRNCANGGDEIVIHGFFHERARRPNESAREKLITRFYTADEAEFFDLEYADARRLIEEAQDEFAGKGFAARGFIAPAWLLGAEAERAAVDAGMNYTTTLRTVRDFNGREVIASQSLAYSVRSEWRRGISLGWNRWLFARLTNNPLLRISLHPPDISHPKIWGQICELIARALHDRKPMTYESYLAHAVFAA